jgi:ribosomal protein L11 methyltransferase
VCAELWLERTLGLELRGDTIDAYWRCDAAPPWSGGVAGVELVAEVVLTEADWAAGWRAAAEPFTLGQRFWIDPGENGSTAAPGDSIVLRLPARRAFGTGTHPSTRLAVEWLESIPLAGRGVIDVGAGSGILSFAARALGARSVVGVELDLESVLLAGANRRRNSIEIALVGGTIEALLGSAFDVVVANLLSSELVPELDRMAALLRPGGDLVYSGALVSERDELAPLFERSRLEIAGERILGEWISWRLRARPSAR